jgi:hypothetical protein
VFIDLAEEVLGESGPRGYWLKVVGTARAALPDDWLGSVAGRELLSSVRFPPNKRPSGIARGDRLVYYASGRHVCFAVVETTSTEPYEDGGDARWPFVLDVRPRLLLARLADAPSLEELRLRKGRLSVRRGSHIRLEPSQYRRALIGILRAGA